MKNLLKKLLPSFVLYWYHWKLAFLAAVIYGWPSRKLKVIGVTGTKGKSTVVYLAGKILAEALNTKSPLTSSFGGLRTGPKGGEPILPFRPACSVGGEGGEGFFSKVGWISSLTINDGKNEVINPYHMTMPGRFFIQKTLRRMAKNGCQYALVEVTSEGIRQHRHRFLNWIGAVFTNLAPEHLEAHGGFENYRAAKEKLFAAAAKNRESFGVYNLDDENVECFLQYPIKNKFGYGVECQNPSDKFSVKSKTQISNIRLSSGGSEFDLDGVKFKISLLGEFNAYNCAAAATIGIACGVSLETTAGTLEKIKSVPGRLEIINEGQNFTVVVDLAHTPDSFAKVFRLFQDLKNESNRIISVFGSAGGGRDKWKRPELGKIASRYSDQAFIANEDPYDEDPLKIADEILAGCDKNKVDIVLDRRAAIARALSSARAGDIVLILGKGTEQTYAEGGKKISWDDRIVAREELKKIDLLKSRERIK